MRKRQKSHGKAVESVETHKKNETEGDDITNEETKTRWKALIGFDPKALLSWQSLVRLLNEPRDPASLAVVRILFGLLMVIDIPQERGMAWLDSRFGDSKQCQFPLFNGLKPLPVDWMYMLYLLMFSGAVGMCIGLFYRLSCVLFVVPYWYVFFLDKTAWNNHSYLYGLLGFQLAFMDANRCWSVDSLLNSKKLRNKHVPLWNYAMLRFQIFIVYFLAGLKKLDQDWVTGYSMNNLAKSWVFDPFKFVLTDDQIDLYIVHHGGLMIDLFTGWLMLFDKTRPFAFVFVGMFHVMNSQLFSIGMFPYAMLATMPIFCYVDWPRNLLAKMPAIIHRRFTCSDVTLQHSEHCIYPEDRQTEQTDTGRVQDLDKDKPKESPDIKKATRPGRYHHIASIWFIVYILVQSFLPYSHFITKGYNNWTNGLYGYSWDMMVHSWHTQHIKIRYIEKGGSREEGYLSPKYFAHNGRWSSHADMTKQYATCISDHLQQVGFDEVEIYIDVWKSMNDRFQQRMFNPMENMIEAEWSPFQPVKWSMPLLTELSDWRSKLKQIEDELGDDVEVTFVADFPGLFLENYLSEDFDNASLTVLSGQVMVELVENGTNITLNEGDKLQLPTEAFHNVHTISKEPSTYMYLVVNGTEVEFTKNVSDALEDVGSSLDELKKGEVNSETISNITDEELASKIRIINSEYSKHSGLKSRLTLERASQFLKHKVGIFKETVSKTKTALGHVLFGYESVMESVKKDLNPGGQSKDDAVKTSAEL